MRKQKGFSLIELLIVVAIILIIAAIAIPNLLNSRIAANEAAAASTVRTLNTTEVTYTTTYPTAGYAPNLSTLGPPSGGGAGTSANAALIDSTLASGTKGQYTYKITSTSGSAPYADYLIYASAIGITSGKKDYCSGPDAVVHYTAVTSAPGTTPPSLTVCAGWTTI